MKLPDKYIHLLIDKLSKSNTSFALYRLPWTDECYFILQTSEKVDTYTDISALNGKKGFVIAPFRQTEEHPTVMIRPDVTAYDWEEITQAIQSHINEEEIAIKQTNITKPVTQLNEKERYERYSAAFQRFMEPLKLKKFKKLVLSRPIFSPIDEEFSPLGAFVKACNTYPRMMIYFCHTPISGTWIGSTPEILLSGNTHNWNTVALAGTMPLKDEIDSIQWSEKNKEEQTLVAEYIRKVIKKFGSKIIEKGPYNARAGQLLHIKSDFNFQLKSTDYLGDLLKELHPTPAVCGLPKE